MTATLPRYVDRETSVADPSARVRIVLIVLAVARGALALLAIPLAPALYRDHVAGLVFLRPTKDVFLFAGFQVTEHHTTIPLVVVAAVPLLIAGVWVFFGLGRSFAEDLADHDLPGIAGRVLPRERVNRLQDILEERGMWVVFFGRLAAFPSTLLAAAAGSSGMGWKRFAIADAAGAAVSIALFLGLGILLQETYEEAGPWLTALGVVVLIGLVVTFGRWLTRDPGAGRRRGGPGGAS
jgi:membrane protein DedA with SNARE-associated domain